MLLHGHDIARGLGLTLDPDRAICARVLTRLFPAETAGLAGTGPWQALRWAAGRAALPGHPRWARWRWRGAPPGE